MKVLVAIKRVVDYQIKIHVNKDSSGIDAQNLKMSINPFDEIAVEEAVRLKEQGKVSEIIVVSIGTDACQEILRSALAMGVDKALLVNTSELFEPLNIAKILAAICQQQQPQLVIMGKQAIDDDSNQVGQMLAGLLGWSQGTFISKLELDQEQATVVREVDAGLETLKLDLPTVLTTDLRLNKPRYLSLPNIMRAKQKPIETIVLDSLGLQLSSRVQQLAVEAPTARKPGEKVKTMSELVDKLRQQEKVLP